MTHQQITGRDLCIGDRIMAFTPDADAAVTDITEMAHGGLMLSLDVYDPGGTASVGSTFFIVNPDAEYAVVR